MPQQKIWLQWNDSSIIWGSNNYIWSEVYILITVGSAGGGGGMILSKKNPWKDVEKQLKDKLTPEETDKFLEIVVRVNGLLKTEVRDLKKVKKMITVDHIHKTLSEFISEVKVTAVDVKRK